MRSPERAPQGRVAVYPSNMRHALTFFSLHPSKHGSFTSPQQVAFPHRPDIHGPNGPRHKEGCV